MNGTWGILAGLGAIVVLIVVYWIFSGKAGKNPLEIVVGADGQPSTSKTQILLWTVVVVWAYIALLVDRLSAGIYDGLPNIPRNVLIALGLSATTWVTAKAITTNQVATGTVNKTSRPVSGLSAILQDDAGYPDLGKVQLLVWTVIALGLFVTQVVHQLSLAPAQVAMPDIDDTLMVLMGLGHGAYVGKKLVTTDRPRISSILPGQGPAGTTVTINGAAFGEAQGGSQITIDGTALTLILPDNAWSDSQIQFQIPPTDPTTNAAWTPPSQAVAIGLVVNSLPSANTVPFTVTTPGTTTVPSLVTTPTQ